MRIERVIEGIVQHARPAIKQLFGPASCIPATRTVIGVLKHYGHQAYPLPVECLVLAGRYAEYIFGGGKWPDSPAAWEALGRGHYAILIGGIEGVSPGRHIRTPERQAGFDDGSLWAGHLVAWVPDGKHGVIIDAALDQADKPEHDLKLPGVVVLQVPRQFRKGGLLHQVRQVDDGTVLQYCARPGNVRGYQSSPLWYDHGEVFADVVQSIVNAIEGRPAPGRIAAYSNRVMGAIITGSRL